jgi:hypothetical protein
MTHLVLFGLLGGPLDVSRHVGIKTQNLISVIQNRLHRELVGKTSRGHHQEGSRRYVAALAEPAVRGKLEQGGVVVIGSTPDELASEIDKWRQVIKPANIRTQ